ncbi:hypothetical protein O6H91_03G025600 [Diphasiastrum complanatum]|uniref:Uncharacterized protein n=4 Tax=Diphasiastrum complanatum TaxID=34168 RepID=A0ACC2E4P8_DIPCM|nr:hypothetical protein O6H91_03G025600 [Diphasiastrum complanatum]
MNSKEKPFLVAVLGMLIVLWMCFYYLRIGPPVTHEAQSFDETPLSRNQFRTHLPQSRHPLAQSALDNGLSDEDDDNLGRSELSQNMRSQLLARMNARYQNKDTSNELSKQKSDFLRDKEKQMTPGKSLPDGSGDAWNEEFQQLTEELLGEVLEELKKVQNATIDRADVIDIPVKVQSDKIADSMCGERNGSGTGQSGMQLKSGLRLFGQALHSFVLFSAYRFSIDEFVVVGLVSVHLREKYGDPVSSCAWLPNGSAYTVDLLFQSGNTSSVQKGIVKLFYVNETLGTDYDIAVCKCTFEDPVGANARGGSLYLNMTSASAKEGFEPVEVLHELPDELLSIQFEGPFRYDYAFCSPPIWGRLHPKHVKEWLIYHHSLWQGKVHYFMYDAGGIDSEIESIFQPLIAQGLITVINIVGTQKFRTFYNSQHLAINDCLQRARFVAKWAFFWDLDEYFQIQPPANISSILAENEDAVWISFGHLVWSKIYCKQEERPDEWAVERMAFHLEYPTCSEKGRSSTCHGSEGLRKWAANPRAVSVGTVYRTLEPEWNGVVFNASIARINHYSGLVAYNDESNCVLIKNLNEVDESVALDGWWWKDISMAENSKKARISSQSLHIFNSSLSSDYLSLRNVARS